MLLAGALVAVHGTATRGAQPSYDLQVALDVSQAKIVGTATIDVPNGTELSIDRGDLTIVRLTNGHRDVAPDARGAGPLALRAKGPVRIRYEGTFRDSDGDVIRADAILLRGIWYPVVEGIYRYRLSATVPRGFEAISEADTVRRIETSGQSTFVFDLPYPQRAWDGMTFVASTQWASRHVRYKDIDLSVHVLSRNAAKLDELTGQAQRYLQRLEGMLGAYPFKRLVIAENPVPLHYSLSMPTYTLLTQQSDGAPRRFLHAPRTTARCG